MRLLIVSFWIACKHSSRRLLCLLCVFLVLAGLVGLGFALQPQTEHPRAVVAVVNRDQNPLSQQAMEWLAQAGPVQGLEGILELRFFQGKTQMEVSAEIGISQAQVSRLEKNALRQIRKEL